MESYKFLLLDHENIIYIYKYLILDLSKNLYLHLYVRRVILVTFARPNLTLYKSNGQVSRS